VYEGDRIGGRIGFLRSDSQNDVAAFETRTPGFTDVSGSLRLRIAGSAERPIDFTVTARNLLDARERNAVSFKKDVALLPGP
jgi:iron complex outermembrane receptor protein